MDEKIGAQLRGRHGCIGIPIVFAIGLFALLFIIATFAVWQRGDLRLPVAGSLEVPRVVGIGGAGCIAAAILGGAMMLAAAILVCCCRKCGDSNLAEFLRTIQLALRVIQASLAALASAIQALTELMAQILATLKTVADGLRDVQLPDQSPGSADLKGMLDGAIKDLENGVKAGEQAGQQVIGLVESLADPAVPKPPR